MIIIIPLIIIVGIIAWLLWPRKTLTKNSMISILATVIPSLLVGAVAVIFQLIHNAAGTVEVSGTSNTLFLVGLGLIGVYILTLVGFLFARKGEIAKGIGFGICISIVISVIELGLLEWLGGV